MSNIGKIKSVFGIVWKISPAYFFLLLFNSLSFSGQVFSNVIIPKFLIDELMGEQRPAILAWLVLAVAGSNLIFTLSKKTFKRLIDVREKDVTWQIERVFAEKIMSVSYANLEDPHYLDLKERASFAMSNQGVVQRLLGSSVDFLKQLLTAAGLVVIMFRLSWILVLTLLITVAVILGIHAYFSGYQQKFFKELLPVNRKYGYYIGLTFDKSIHKDARIYGMDSILGDTIKDYNIEINRWFSKFYRRMGLTLGLFQVVTVLQTAIAYGYVGARTLDSVGIGDLTMYVASAIGFSTAVIELGSAIVNIFQMLGYLEPFAELMSVPDEAALSGSRKLGPVRSVSFEHVSFTYPKTDKKILDDISFEIEEGEKISIVGFNGAGKSTVVKLLCRLYSPDSGRILINGYDIREYDHASYLAGIAAVFQDFKLFNFTVGENITCRPAGTDKEKTRLILGEVGLTGKIDSLPHGLDSLFGKEYDESGVEFSGGQAQKIAIARALYKDASLVILDEPTSALDPLAEAEIYENFNRMVGSKTAIYISHRMSSSVFCDRVMVISGGKIEAFDTHRKLMENKEGTYFRLFSSQAENYRLA